MQSGTLLRSALGLGPKRHASYLVKRALVGTGFSVTRQEVGCVLWQATSTTATSLDSESTESEQRLFSNSTASTSTSQTARGQGDGQLDAGLYIVGTPIGNLEDITLRALRVLREANVVLAEDTRHSRKLLNHFGIEAKLVSFHEHNEHGKQEQVLALLRNRSVVALISDAGMPLVSDPGGSLVKAVIHGGFRVFPIPGPSAVLSALVASGLPAASFLFGGFLPPKSAARMKALEELAGISATLIFFSPPHSLLYVLADLAQVLGRARQCAVARELTKVHEEFYRGTLAEAAAEFGSRSPKVILEGEITIVVEGFREAQRSPLNENDIEARLQELLQEGNSASSAAKQLSRDLGLPRNSVYAIATRLKEEGRERIDPPVA